MKRTLEDVQNAVANGFGCHIDLKYLFFLLRSSEASLQRLIDDKWMDVPISLLTSGDQDGYVLGERMYPLFIIVISSQHSSQQVQVDLSHWFGDCKLSWVTVSTFDFLFNCVTRIESQKLSNADDIVSLINTTKVFPSTKRVELCSIDAVKRRLRENPSSSFVELCSIGDLGANVSDAVFLVLSNWVHDSQLADFKKQSLEKLCDLIACVEDIETRNECYKMLLLELSFVEESDIKDVSHFVSTLSGDGKGFVYVMCDWRKPYACKIGCSYFPLLRLRHLQTGNPWLFLHEEGQFRVSFRHMFRAEKAIHAALDVDNNCKRVYFSQSDSKSEFFEAAETFRNYESFYNYVKDIARSVTEEWK